MKFFNQNNRFFLIINFHNRFDMALPKIFQFRRALTVFLFWCVICQLFCRLFWHLFSLPFFAAYLATFFAAFLPPYLVLLFLVGFFWVLSTNDVLFWVCSTKVCCTFLECVCVCVCKSISMDSLLLSKRVCGIFATENFAGVCKGKLLQVCVAHVRLTWKRNLTLWKCSMRYNNENIWNLNMKNDLWWNYTILKMMLFYHIFSRLEHAFEVRKSIL
jgi:hypothetical protein